MDNEDITKGVENAIKTIIDDFENNPDFFYTENDIISRLYELIQRELRPNEKFQDKNGYSHYLVHTEYPTPFRVDMSNKDFKKIPYNQGKGKKRGHYDIVVLNPNFIERNGYREIIGQKEKEMIECLKNFSNTEQPVILYAIEVIFTRDPKRNIESDFVNNTLQDYKKLQESKTLEGKFLGGGVSIEFIKHSTTLAFDNAKYKENEPDLKTLRQKIKGALNPQNSSELKYIYPIKNRV